MLQSNDYQLHHVKQEISRKVSFPEELSVTIDENAARELLAEIRACESDADLTTLTFSLSRRRLNDLFGAVLVVSAADGEVAINRLLDIFKKRATNSLAQTAWAFYQRHYPNDRLGRVLFSLIRSLESKDEKKEEKHIFLDELRSLSIDKQLPQRLAERLRRQPDDMKKARRAVTGLDKAIAGTKPSETVPAGSDVMPLNKIQEKYPLLAAYTSLTSIPDQSMRQNCLSSGLCSYMIRLSILPDTSFTAAFLQAYFLDTTDQDILDNADLFLQALQLGSASARLTLMRRYLRDYRMGESWNGLNEAILETFGAPSDASSPGTANSAAGPASEATTSASRTITQENQQMAGKPESVFSSIDSMQERPVLQSAPYSSIAPQATIPEPVEQKGKGLMSWLRGRKSKTDVNENNQPAQESVIAASAPEPLRSPAPTLPSPTPAMTQPAITPIQTTPEPSVQTQSNVFDSKPTRRYAKLGEPDHVQPVGGFKAFDFDKLLKAEPAPTPASAPSPVATAPVTPVAGPAATTPVAPAGTPDVAKTPDRAASDASESSAKSSAVEPATAIEPEATATDATVIEAGIDQPKVMPAEAVAAPAIPEPDETPATPVATQPPSVETAKVLVELQQALLAGLGQNRIDDTVDEAQTTDLPGDRSIWEMLERPVVDRFRQWEFMHQISLHNPGNKRKLLFYQRYSLEIRRIIRWDNKAIIVQFTSFVIADYAEEEDQVWYYDLNTYQMLSEHKFHRPALNKPEQAVMSSRMAMLSESKSNIVRLQLDAINLLYSHDFLNNLKNAEKNAGKKNGGSLI